MIRRAFLGALLLALSFGTAGQITLLGAGKNPSAGGGSPPTLTCRTIVFAATAAVTDSSFTPGNGDLVIAIGAFVEGSDSGSTGSSITIDDTGAVQTWTHEVATADDAPNWAQGARVAWTISGGSAITVRTTRATGSRRAWLQVCTVPAGTFNASDPIGAVGTGGDTDGTGAASVTLGATPAASSTTLGVAVSTVQAGNPTFTPGSGFSTIVTENTDSGWAAIHIMQSQGHNSTTVGWDDLDATGDGYATNMLAFEVKAP